MNERMDTHKVGLIGTGMVGASFAYALMQRGVADELVLIDADSVEAILRDQHTVKTVSSPLTGKYGVNDISISMPTIVGRSGVEQVLTLPLSEAELRAFQASAQTLKERLSQL